MTQGKSFRLVLLRHGNTFNDNETPYQVGLKSDLPLTEKGLLQASQFTDYLKTQSTPPFAIYSGALLRQSKTASILHQAFPEATLHIGEHAFDEIDYGAWEGLAVEEIEAKWGAQARAWHEQGTWPQGIFEQDLSTHLTKLRVWLDTLQQTTPNNALVIAVSSQGIIRLLLNFMPALWDKIVSEKAMGDYKVGTGRFCELRVSSGELSIVAWNQRP